MWKVKYVVNVVYGNHWKNIINEKEASMEGNPNVENVKKNIKNNGIHRSSFAVVRQTNPISVLIEVAYLINPEEYHLLKNENFRYRVAHSIKKSLEEYICKINCQNE